MVMLKQDVPCRCDHFFPLEYFHTMSIVVLGSTKKNESNVDEKDWDTQLHNFSLMADQEV